MALVDTSNVRGAASPLSPTWAARSSCGSAPPVGPPPPTPIEAEERECHSDLVLIDVLRVEEDVGGPAVDEGRPQRSDFEDIEVLGSGSFGSVLLAVNKKTGQKVRGKGTAKRSCAICCSA
jgi:serine/threonine protein kinase